MAPANGALAIALASGLAVALALACGGDLPAEDPLAADPATTTASATAAATAPLRLGGHPPLVLLISLDTFRADALGALSGRQPSLTPALDHFAADSVLFTRVLAPMAFTLPSHMTMFTGLYPVAHGVTTEKDVLAPGIGTLPQWLGDAGFHTVGRITNEWLKGEFGFDRGFDSYVRLRHDLTYADRVNADALDVVRSRGDDGRPLFLFLHYMDPHSDFMSRRNRLPYYALPELLDGLATGPEDPRYCDAEGRCATSYLQQADREKRHLPGEEIAAIRSLYEAGVRGLDAELGRLFDALRQEGVYDDALIVVTADHGEEFREHGRFLHSQTYQESLHVPLLFKLPGGARAGERVDGMADLVDLSPTLLDLLGLPIPPQVRGVSLAPSLAGGATGRTQALGQDKLQRSLYALQTDRFKLLNDLGDGRTELYDLLRDPGETLNRSEEYPRVVQSLRRRLRAMLREEREVAQRLAAPADSGAEKKTLLSDEERERLKSLGYL